MVEYDSVCVVDILTSCVVVCTVYRGWANWETGGGSLTADRSSYSGLASLYTGITNGDSPYIGSSHQHQTLAAHTKQPIQAVYSKSSYCSALNSIYQVACSNDTWSSHQVSKEGRMLIRTLRSGHQLFEESRCIGGRFCHCRTDWPGLVAGMGGF